MPQAVSSACSQHSEKDCPRVNAVVRSAAHSYQRCPGYELAALTPSGPHSFWACPSPGCWQRTAPSASSGASSPPWTSAQPLRPQQHHDSSTLQHRLQGAWCMQAVPSSTCAGPVDSCVSLAAAAAAAAAATQLVAASKGHCGLAPPARGTLTMLCIFNFSSLLATTAQPAATSAHTQAAFDKQAPWTCS